MKLFIALLFSLTFYLLSTQLTFAQTTCVDQPAPDCQSNPEYCYCLGCLQQSGCTFIHYNPGGWQCKGGANICSGNAVEYVSTNCSTTTQCAAPAPAQPAPAPAAQQPAPAPASNPEAVALTGTLTADPNPVHTRSDGATYPQVSLKVTANTGWKIYIYKEVCNNCSLTEGWTEINGTGGAGTGNSIITWQPEAYLKGTYTLALFDSNVSGIASRVNVEFQQVPISPNQPKQPPITPQQPTKTVTRIQINEADITPQVGASLKVSLPVADPTKESDNPVRVIITYSDGTSDASVINFHYKPKTNTSQPTSSNEFLVDVIIHKSLTDQNEAVAWAKDTINNYVNTRFANADIKHRIKVDKIISNWDDQTGCPVGGTAKANTCEFSDPSKIRVWLYKDWAGGIGTSAGPHINQVWIKITAYTIAADDEVYKRTLTHEIGHLFKMPDYYYEDVYPFNNYVVPIGITPYSKDIMWQFFNYDFFSETSKGFADRTTSLPAGFGAPSWYLQYLPKNTILKITNEDNSPLVGAKIEVFPQSLTKTSNGTSLPYIISPAIVTINTTTDNKGEINLGDYMNIFHHVIRGDNFTASITGSSAFLRITNSDKIRYTAITRSYLNYLYFQGQTETTTITKKFSELVAYDPNKTTILSAQKPTLSGDGNVTTEAPLNEEERKLLDKHLKEHLEQEQIFNNQQPTTQTTPTTPTSTTPTAFDNGNFIKAWQSGKYNPKFDCDHNNIINTFDYGMFIAGKCQ